MLLKAEMQQSRNRKNNLGDKMTDLDIKHSAFHAIDYHRAIADVPEASFNNAEVKNYIQGIIPFLHKKRNNRAFQFSSDTGETSTLTNKYASIADCDFDATSLALATRLAKEEQKANQRYGHLNQLHAGGLVQVVYEAEDQFVILIAKVDYNNFLDKSDYTRRSGLPFERYVLKAFTMTFDIDSETGEMNETPTLSVFDTNASISKYWWREFLELEELNTNEANTVTALDAHLRLLKLKLSRNYKSDYTLLRNRVISYFKTCSDYKHDDALDIIFRGYHPLNTELQGEKYDRLLVAATTLPDQKGFDRQFSVVADKVKAKMGHRIPLRPNMELSLLGEIDDLENVVTASESDGRKYITIESESGFEYFKKNGIDAPNS
nr:nucleoid-associated protein [Pontiella desulfatans]